MVGRDAEVLFGLEPHEIGLTFEDFLALIHEQDRATVEKVIQTSIKNCADHEVEFRVVHQDGSIHWMVKRGKVIKDRFGHAERVIGIGLDITDRKNFEKRIVDTAEQLWRANKELEQFAYVSSHDLQEPLRKISIYSQMLGQKISDDDPAAGKLVESISSSVYRLQKLIEDILAYSRLSKNDIARSPVDFKKLADSILSDLEISIEESRAEIVVGPLPVLTAHPTQMYQLLQNLIRNAIKFRGDGPPKIAVSAEKKGNEWMFAVRDNGIGIDPKYGDKIFEVFQRLHSRNKYPGNGIGLALSKRVVEQHGGKIWFESAEGIGTTFYFTLPNG